jgi:tryptophanyl-tRNA synthetase
MTTKNKKRLLSGVKPTGRPHIGNYFGALRQFVEFQDDYETLIMIADYHALTTLYQPDELKENSFNLAVDYLAIGLDPKKTILFRQSDVPAHTTLAWIFNCLTTMPYLMRAHAYKDAQAKNREVSVGTFTYPLLMAADILLYDTDIVPVGKDQKQHVEYTRDIALKFNHQFGPTFKLPEAKIVGQTESIIGIDGQKMSKSYNNTIPLFANDEEIEKKVMTIKTDSLSVAEPKNPEQCNIFYYHKLFTPKDDLKKLKQRYLQGGIGYQESKKILIDNIVNFIKPLREKRQIIAGNKKEIERIFTEGAKRAQAMAGSKMEEVNKKIGIDLFASL